MKQKVCSKQQLICPFCGLQALRALSLRTGDIDWLEIFPEAGLVAGSLLSIALPSEPQQWGNGPVTEPINTPITVPSSLSAMVARSLSSASPPLWDSRHP